MKKNCFFTLYLLLLLLFYNCAGITHPKIIYSFKQIGEVPPFAADDRLNQEPKFEQELLIWFSQPGNRFSTSFEFYIFAKQPYEFLYIKSAKYFYEDRSGVLFDDIKIKLPEYINQREKGLNSYYEKNGYYWARKASPYNQKPPSVNFQKIFKKRKSGEKFVFSIEFEYSFDNEELKKLNLKYEVTAVKNWYLSPYTFIPKAGSCSEVAIKYEHDENCGSMKMRGNS